MLQAVQTYCEIRVQEFNQISDERKITLEKIAAYINSSLAQRGYVKLVYVCTHNSRRSHFGQVWAKVAAAYFAVQGVETYSGGTEETAFNGNAIAALERCGLQIVKTGAQTNPVYEVFFEYNVNPCICFSKVYNHVENPQQHFAAVMTCSDAENNCPFIPNVELRIATTYNDPKAFDSTPTQDEQYDARCAQIARECLYVFSNVKNQQQ